MLYLSPMKSNFLVGSYIGALDGIKFNSFTKECCFNPNAWEGFYF